MARQPRRMNRYITRSEIIATVFIALIAAWLALVAVGMGV